MTAARCARAAQVEGWHVDAGGRLARSRVEDVYAAVDGLAAEQLSWPMTPPIDVERRTELLAGLEAAADRHGRGPLLDEARAWLREALPQRLLARAAGMAESGVVGASRVGRPEDIARTLLALEDAVSVAATEDLLRPADAAALADPGRRLLDLAPLDGSSTDPVPGARGWEPSPADWAAAEDDGSAAIDHDAPMGDSGNLRAGFFGVVGSFGVLAALAAGVANDQVPVAILAAGLIAALAWTFATRRPLGDR